MPKERRRSRSRDGHSRSRRSRSRDRRSRSRDHRRREQSTRDERPSTSSHHKKKKSKSHRRRSSSSSSSASSSRSNASHNSMKLLKVLEDRRVEEHLERKRLKQEMKANETLEQKRARRLAEKQAKEQRRRQRMGWDTEYQHYTNDDNPFGDSTLTSTFVWNKKLEKDGLRGVPLETVEVLSRQKQLENKLELEKVKKRRMERELERQAREEEMTLMQRSKEAAQFQEWERQEDQFHLEQARLRSIIRIQDGRAKPIDLLAQYISSENLDEIEMQMHEPYLLLNGLEIKDLEDLLVDIKVYIELEKGNNSDFWDDMTVIVEDELHKLRKIEAENERTAATGRREGIHQNVAKDVSEIFRGKSTKELDELRERIESKIAARSDGVDISYWETLLYQLKAHMARSRLRDRHRASLRQKLSILRKAPDELGEGAGDSGEFGAQIKKEHDADAPEGGPEGSGGFDDFDDCFRQYEEGSYSPEYLTASQAESSGYAVITAEQDEDRFNAIRSQILERLHADKTMSREEAMMRSEARKGMAGDEAEFSVETPLDTPIQLASDKYRPRKPRYFNRVHTGFEWNKYNQTHYDMDNPPPKIVQGYKFNIFYPDLIDKSVTPQYFLTACKDNGDFAILRFHAGPPYEDIAFKVVNREWEFSYKRGFRCQFQNNVFQLWFHFKRYRYRR